MKLKIILLIFFLGLNIHFIFSQVTQTLKGTVIDKDSRFPLPGATIILTSDTSELRGTTTDENGNYKIEKVPVGRASIKIRFLGYKEVILSNIIINSGKETIANIELEESATTIDVVEISAVKKEQALNEMSLVSSRTFAVDETERYAGSRGDPARMASNFAGVQGADDSRNDLIIRGNSPFGVLWRLEGIDIPNPNHFSVAGSTGGPVSILNNKVLSNSDFHTGAFPAEFGNSTAGVFDINMRKGNYEKYEFGAQLGFLGTEAVAEGPLFQNKSSFLLSYRYSTLKLFESFNINIGTTAVPSYQDAAIIINFRTGKGNISFFGVGGKSNIDILVSEFTESQDDLYSDTDRDQYFSTAMGVTGISYSHHFSSSTYGKLVLAVSGNQSKAHHELVYRNPESFTLDSLIPNLGYEFNENKYSAAYFINKKINVNHSFKTGIHYDLYNFDFSDSTLNIFTRQFFTRLNYSGEAYLLQPYFQWKYKRNLITATAGIHGQYFTLNDYSKSIEPRAGFKYEINDKSSVSLGLGLHSQMQPSYIYFNQIKRDYGSVILHNKSLGFTRSAHLVIGWDYFPSRNIRLKAETYYQYLYEVPVEKQPSAFSVINKGTGFSRFFPDELVNDGTGKNYGIELTVEKFFSNKYFFLFTASLYDSRYTGSDGIERNTDFNSNYATNLMGGREFKISSKSILNLGGKITYAGGKLYSPADPVASALADELITIDALTNTLRFDDYFRTDLKLSFKINSDKVTHEFALDLINIFNKRNVLGLSYAPDTFNPTADPIRKEYQLGFLPLFYYRIEFGLKLMNK
jgi:hypothetical protein